ncbi:hypothetical protein ABEB36_003826 [Hypothenemus hampei]|uniref:Uncharacterized protein n=1 Tax=Hypothenemus hampei TaxID=57062 RepID=A0ABD1F2K1_HYPHA
MHSIRTTVKYSSLKIQEEPHGIMLNWKKRRSNCDDCLIGRRPNGNTIGKYIKLIAQDTSLMEPTPGASGTQQLLPSLDAPNDSENDYPSLEAESIASDVSTASQPKISKKDKLKETLMQLKRHISRTRCLDCSKLHRELANNPTDLMGSRIHMEQAIKHLNTAHKNITYTGKRTNNTTQKLPKKVTKPSLAMDVDTVTQAQTPAKLHNPTHSTQKPNEDFQTPLKNTKLRQLLRQNTPTLTQNRFLPLQNNPDTQEESQPSTSTGTQVKQGSNTQKGLGKKPRIPPLILKGQIHSHKDFIQSLKRTNSA